LAFGIAEERRGSGVIRGLCVPSYRIGAPVVSLRVYDAVGEDGDQIGFICHAGLAESAGSQHAHEIAVLDMGPPLQAGERARRLQASAVGSAELTDDEVQKIRTFVDRHVNEHQALLKLSQSQLLRSAPQMYCIYPHAIALNEDYGRYVRTRFSCAGFVFEAYRAARIKLLDTNALPTVDMSVIKSAYPRQARLIEGGWVSHESLGLEGNGPWPVMFCGYLFHALDREAGLIRQQPFTASTDNQYFF
jgi:hypothetical protein